MLFDLLHILTNNSSIYDTFCGVQMLFDLLHILTNNSSIYDTLHQGELIRLDMSIHDMSIKCLCDVEIDNNYI